MMHVNIPQARNALLRENIKLNEVINYERTSVSAFSSFIEDESLQGQFYDAAKKYIRCVAKPLYGAFIEAVNAKLQANLKYDSELVKLLPYGLIVDLEKLLQRRDQLRAKIAALQKFADANPVCFLISYSMLDKLRNICIQLEHAISVCYRFQINTAECYDDFNSRIDRVLCGIAAAKSICSVTGGTYSFNSAQIRAWAKITNQEMELCPCYCPDYAAWNKMSEEDKKAIGPLPGSPDYIEDNFEFSRLKDGTLAHVVATWNASEELSCTFYTLRRLRERGLGYPFLHAGANGNQWYSNCDESVPGAEGRQCVETLFNQYGELTNVVVCFPTDPTGQWGHVVLVDRAYMDSRDGKLHVVFDDTRNYSDPNGSHPAEDITYDEFLARYKSWGNGEPTGARYIGGPIE